jgi:diguanylate cyclase (GGDEF)-like protein/PAS domain S-box-containing protein
MKRSIIASGRQMKIWRHEFRTILPKLGVRWMMGNSLPEKQEDESIIWYGVITDINERKLTEGGVQLAAMVYQNSTEAIVVTNAANNIIAVNPAFSQLTGYSADEAINQNPRILKSGRHEIAFYESMWEAILKNGKWQGELWNRRKDGTIYATWLNISTTYFEDGSPHYFVGLSSDITERKKSEKLIWQQANFDNLTGLPNRNLFRQHIELEFKKSQRTGMPTALILLDLDDFKDVNDTLGHDMGDALLQEAAERLRQCVRDSDIVARLGGDEFAIIIGEIPDHSVVERITDVVLQSISQPYYLKGELIHISASIGISFFPKDATEIESLLKNADQAMYAAKRLGRNRSHYFDRSMQDAAQTRMRIINDLRAVLDGSQFALHYQPIVELSTGTIQRAEALIRWHHPKRGLIRPAEFIQVAEETGMIMDIGNWVFREAVKQVAIWRSTLHPDFQVSINVSPMQFRRNVRLLSAFIGHQQKLNVPGQSIVIEITEGLLLDATPHISEELLAFRDAGIQVAIDDFGTGYSSLAYLKKFDIDYIKIDRSFVSNLTLAAEDRALCEAIIVMAHTLGMKVIAEGIETDEQRKLLTAVGCDFGQGYLFCKPLPAAEFEALLQSFNETTGAQS